MKKYLFLILFFVSCTKIQVSWDNRELENVLLDNNTFVMVYFYTKW
jgi:hypothetical protein